MSKPTRSQRARQTAIKSGYWQYGLEPSDLDYIEESIQSSHSEFVTRLGKLTIHRLAADNQLVYCAYDSNIGKVGFFIDESLGRRIMRRTKEKKRLRRAQQQNQGTTL